MKKVFLYAVALIIFSCGKQEQIPEDILGEAEMVSMLIDIRIAEGKVATITLSKDSSASLYQELERQIFENQQVDSAVYLKSYNYYLLHPEKFLSITSIVIDSLKLRQQIVTTGRRSSK